MIINLNTLCKVKLNEFGKNVWLSQIDEIPDEIKQSHPEVVETIKNKLDENGYVELELWAMMNLFGHFLSPVESPFEINTFEINKNPNFGNYFVKETNNDDT